MNSAAGLAAGVRKGAGWFELPQRRVIEVTGSDRVRWLNGMLSNDIAALEENGPNNGCSALLLTRQGRIVADMVVLARPDAFWLDLDVAAADAVIATLEKFIVADDVELARRPDLERLGVEGPRSSEVVAALIRGELPELVQNCCAEVEFAGHSALIAAGGWSGEASFQIFFSASEGVSREIRRELAAASTATGGVEGSPETLEILRIEAGIPRFGSELGEDVLPAEARLANAISTTKGCYTGQEVVERMRSRGRVGHLLVGLRGTDVPPESGMSMTAEPGASASVGEVTSACRSDIAGAIALGFVRAAHAETGTRLYVSGGSLEVSTLPFVAPSPTS